jgi:hypothetical protein
VRRTAVCAKERGEFRTPVFVLYVSCTDCLHERFIEGLCLSIGLRPGWRYFSVFHTGRFHELGPFVALERRAIVCFEYIWVPKCGKNFVNHRNDTLGGRAADNFYNRVP